jgi:predicted N-acyltransferase
LFREHPPVGFTCETDASGLTLFFTDFDLLTTLDTAARARLAKLPFSAALTRRLRFPARFAGTTITEYAPLPEAVSPADMLNRLLPRPGDEQALAILKDIPDASPFLSGEDNAYADELARLAVERGFIEVKGQALAYLPLDFGDIDGYFAKLSRERRKNLRRKMKTRGLMEVETIALGDARFSNQAFLGELYEMYLEVYKQSRIHFDLLSPSFFAALFGGAGGNVNGLVVCYRRQGVLAGYNICLIHNDLMIDKYIGFRYPLSRELNLYFVSWLVNLEIALERRCAAYIAGWTDPEVKASLGAKFTFTRHLVWVGNPVLRRLLRPLRRFFESDSNSLNRAS